ncbi:MAG: dATP pyrophosphohydrolase [Parvularculaceae bacterium]|nr:dATP pyrophosphohydrolase [Parvularculaceae bacterium]
MAAAAITVEPVSGPAGRKAFIAAGKVAYMGDPHYVAPLEFEVSARLDPNANPALKGADVQLFIAKKDGAVAGRISAFINPLHLATYHDATGHFGFLDAIDDAEVFAALLKTAEEWMRARDMKKIAGPFSFSVNEECGLLIDGFDAPPYVMMPHGRPWYAAHVEAAGYKKAMDMYALRYIPRRQFIPEKRMKFVERALSSPKVKIRTLDMRNFNREIATLVDIYKDAWSDNWGFVPMTEAQIAHMAKELRPIIEPYNIIFCEYDGEPVAFGLVLPNVMQAIRDFDGKLLPFNWAKLLWRLKVKKLPEARMPLMGVRKKLHGKPIGAAFAYKIIEMVNSSNMDHGVVASELSWILETNKDMLTMLTDMGGEIYKTYRIYERGL